VAPTVCLGIPGWSRTERVVVYRGRVSREGRKGFGSSGFRVGGRIAS
jgi:hypothetical protein